MFATVITACLLVSANGFTAPRSASLSRQQLFSSIPSEEPEAAPRPVEIPVAPAPTPAKILKAQWLPFGINAPKVLDGSLAADVGFDPLGLAKGSRGLYWMREAEVKHARLAMLAAIGWPLSELLHKQIAGVFGLQVRLMNNT